jgi:hypothetical protein
LQKSAASLSAPRVSLAPVGEPDRPAPGLIGHGRGACWAGQVRSPSPAFARTQGLRKACWHQAEIASFLQVAKRLRAFGRRDKLSKLGPPRVGKKSRGPGTCRTPPPVSPSGHLKMSNRDFSKTARRNTFFKAIIVFDDDQNWVLNTPCSLRLSEERKSVRLQYMEDKIRVESLVLQGRFIIAVHRAFVSGTVECSVRGPTFCGEFV